MKIYINPPQTICIHPVKFRLKIPSHLGGVRRQRATKQTCDGQTDRQTDRHALKRLLCIRSEIFYYYFFLMTNY